MRTSGHAAPKPQPLRHSRSPYHSRSPHHSPPLCHLPLRRPSATPTTHRRAA